MGVVSANQHQGSCPWIQPTLLELTVCRLAIRSVFKRYFYENCAGADQQTLSLLDQRNAFFNENLAVVAQLREHGEVSLQGQLEGL
jgi:hypothetical protein